jgi:hypothetical protein
MDEGRGVAAQDHAGATEIRIGKDDRFVPWEVSVGPELRGCGDTEEGHPNQQSAQRYTGVGAEFSIVQHDESP